MGYIKHLLRPYFHFVRSHLYALIAGYPAKKLNIVAVTGTDGKTSTCMMLYKLFRDQNLNVGLATTVWLAEPGQEPQRNTTKMTSLPPSKIQSFFRKCLQMKADVVIVESSSVALHQHRMAGMQPYVSGVTNFTREEMAYHRTMRHYERCKQRVLKYADHAVLPRSLRDWKKRTKGEVVYYDRANVPAGTLMIPGEYNYDNAALVYEVGKIFRIKDENIFKSLQEFRGVVGRMEKVADPYGRHIYVDYAVTPAAFESVLTSLKHLHPESSIIHVFGATGGGRDRKKRPFNGEMSARYSDKLILTDEESYGEPVSKIINDIASGVPPEQIGKVEMIPDREQAMRHALSLARVGDVILTTGMGGELTRNVSGTGGSESETSKKLGGQDVPWEEEKILETLASEIEPA